MSSTRNIDSVTNQGEFQPSVPRDEPLTTKGVGLSSQFPNTRPTAFFSPEQQLTTPPPQHQVGQKVSPADNAPEFSAQTLPAGSAPADRTFQPNTTSEVPGQADNENVLRSHGKESTYTSASDTLGGTDSGAMHTGLGHPGQGQTSSELRHDGDKHRNRQRAGLEGIGATGGSGMVDERVNASQRGLERDEAVASGTRGDKGALGAEEQIPASAQDVAAERR